MTCAMSCRQVEIHLVAGDGFGAGGEGGEDERAFGLGAVGFRPVSERIAASVP